MALGNKRQGNHLNLYSMRRRSKVKSIYRTRVVKDYREGNMKVDEELAEYFQPLKELQCPWCGSHKFRYADGDSEFVTCLECNHTTDYYEAWGQYHDHFVPDKNGDKLLFGRK
jgi:hypothetical protein